MKKSRMKMSALHKRGCGNDNRERNQEKEKKKKKKREKASGLYTKRQAEFRKTVAATFLARLAYFAIGRRRNVPSSFNGLARESSLISLSSSSLSIYIYYAYA